MPATATFVARLLRTRASRAVSVALVFLVTACSGSSSHGQGPVGDAGGPGDGSSACTAPPADAGPPYFPCDVDAILEQKCRTCHTTKAVQDVCYPQKKCERAPFPLLVWSDTRRDLGGGALVYEHIADVVGSGYMPLQSSRMQPPAAKLTDAEKAVLVDWANHCAPPGEAACPGSDGAVAP